MKIVEAVAMCMGLLNDSMSGDMERAHEAMRRVETMDPKDVMIGFVSLLGAMTIVLQENNGQRFVDDLFAETKDEIIQSSEKAERFIRSWGSKK